MDQQLDTLGIIIPCTNCEKKNRVPYTKLGQAGKCGHCGAMLPMPSKAFEIEQEALFPQIIGQSPLPVVVDFWAPWCGPCRQVAPEVEKVASSHAGEWLVLKVNTERFPLLAARYQIRSIPTMLVFTNGKETARTSGARPAPAIEEFVRTGRSS